MENRELKNNDDFAFIYNPYFVALEMLLKVERIQYGFRCEDFYARQKY